MAERKKSAAKKSAARAGTKISRKKAKSKGNDMSTPAVLSDILPLPERKFEGRIGTYYTDSEAEVPSMASAPVDAPNILLILLDDVGFGHTSTFGGPVSTPTLQKLADEGLRYNRFHTTALCSPTRAALLTGCNHHSAHTGIIMELATPVAMAMQ
jgi:arylsulfatase